MNFDTWVIYMVTVVAFMSTPGPSHILMLSNSIGNGFKKSTATAAGDLSANFLQMLAAAVGLITLLQQFQHYFIFVKWAGVIYLLYLGLKSLSMRPSEFDLTTGKHRSAKSLFWQGFLTSAANPKAIIFFAALFPQFIVSTQSLLPQFLVLSLSYLIIDGVFLCFYGRFAELFVSKFRTSIGLYFNQIAGGLFVGAAILLGLKEFEKN